MLYLVRLQACFHSFDSWQRDGHFMQEKIHLPLKLLCQISHTVSSNNQTYKPILLLNSKSCLKYRYLSSPSSSRYTLLLNWCILDNVSECLTVSLMATLKQSNKEGNLHLPAPCSPAACMPPNQTLGQLRAWCFQENLSSKLVYQMHQFQ